jgi:sigma-E factor negative regulatory protein RseB
VNLVIRPLRGPAGRRAVVVAAVIAVLVAGLSFAEGGGGNAGQRSQRRPARQPGQPAEAGLNRGGAGLTPGMPLLDRAVRAVQRFSYQGVQVISWRAPSGSADWLGSGASKVWIDVWHRAGVGTLTRMASAAPSAATWSDLTEDPSGQLPDGVLGLTPGLLGLLGTNYGVFCTGTGTAEGRPARVVEALRSDGTIAAKFWLDVVTSLPLRRELFDDRAQLISEDDFTALKRGPAGAAQAAGGQSAAGVQATVYRPWPDQLRAGKLAALRSGGWPVPGPMPGGLTLFSASESATPTGKVIDLAYSDGLSAVSLFVQRGQLPARLHGWQKTDLNGNRLYVRNAGEPNLTWSARGFVYTVVAAAPAPVVATVVDVLPHQRQPGFWSRMYRGVRRLASWLNPFG